MRLLCISSLRQLHSDAKPPYHRYQLAVVNNGIINDDCTNLIPGQKICLGYEGEDCTTVYGVFLVQFLTNSLAHSAS